MPTLASCCYGNIACTCKDNIRSFLLEAVTGWSWICIWWADATNEHWHGGMRLICKYFSPESDPRLASSRDARTDLLLSSRLEFEEWIITCAYESNGGEMIFIFWSWMCLWLHWKCLYAHALFITVHWIRMPSSGQFPSFHKCIFLSKTSPICSGLFWLPVETVKMGLILFLF